jgi:hypothetical protein
MRKLILSAFVCILVLAAPGVTPTARAGLLTPLEASALVQSTATETDAMLLSLFYGYHVIQPLSYDSMMFQNNWSGNFHGSYIGENLNLTYQVDLSNYPSGAVTWTNSGSYGIQSWSSSGSATIIDTSSNTFQVLLNYSMRVGSNSASIDNLIPGTVTSSGTIIYGSPVNGEFGSGTLIENGTTYSNKLLYYDIIFSSSFASSISFLGVEWDGAGSVSPNGGIRILMESGPLPEPTSFLLMGFGLLSLVWIRRSVGKAGASETETGE